MIRKAWIRIICHTKDPRRFHCSICQKHRHRSMEYRKHHWVYGYLCFGWLNYPQLCGRSSGSLQHGGILRVVMCHHPAISMVHRNNSSKLLGFRYTIRHGNRVIWNSDHCRYRRLRRRRTFRNRCWLDPLHWELWWFTWPAFRLYDY